SGRPSIARSGGFASLPHGRRQRSSFPPSQFLSFQERSSRSTRRCTRERGASMTEAESRGDLSASDGNRLALSAWCVVAAFGAYFCMYAFRKPFTAGTYADVSLGGVGYKTLLVTAQVLGYTLSKFLGIKTVAEIQPHRRVALLLTLIAIALGALL